MISSYAMAAGRSTGWREPPDRLSAVDLINLAVEADDTPMAVGAVMVLHGRALCDRDGRLRLEEIRVAIEDRLADVPQLRRVMHRGGPLTGRPVWIDDRALRIEQHVSQAEPEPPGDEESLLRLATRLMRPVLDRSHPLWRMWLVPGLTDGRLAIIIKVHHVVADGYAAIELVSSLLAMPLPDTPQQGRAWRPAPAPRLRDLAADNARATVTAMRRAASWSSLRRLVVALGAHRQVLATAWGAPRTSLNAPVGPRRQLAVLHLSLATAKQVAHHYGGRVNDVVLSLATAGLRALLRSRAEQVDGLWLRCTVAVSLRPPGPAAQAGNRTGGFVVRLPCGASDPGARLTLIAAETTRAKQHQQAGAANALLVGLARLRLARFFSRRQRLTNLLESDIVGPTTPIRLLGAPVYDLIPIGNLAGNLGVSFLALSYAGQLVITVQADADRFPDLPVLMTAMRRDWTALSSAAAGR